MAVAVRAPSLAAPCLSVSVKVQNKFFQYLHKSEER